MSRLLIALLFMGSAFSLVYLWFDDHPNPELAATKLPANDAASVLNAPPLQHQRTETVEHIASLFKTDRLLEQAPQEFFQTLPTSLSEVPRPIDLGMNENGDLIIDQRVRSLFEYYLMATGEETLQDIILRIQYDLLSQLEPDAYQQANSLLEGYLQYRNNIGVINNQYADQTGTAGSSLETMKAAKRAVRESRTDFLSPESSAAFFAAEDEYDDYMIGRATVLSDASLSQQEKRQQLELIDLNSPAQLVSAHRQSRILSEVGTQVNQLRSDGATENEIYSYRQQQLGVEVADRLTKLDVERQAWQTRMAAYRAELKGLEETPGYAIEERERMIEALREQHFEQQELLRVRALDRNRPAASN